VKEALRIRMEKQNDIWEDFYATDAMTTYSWKNSNQELRHVITRLAVHGFHSRVCSDEKFHELNSECVSYVVNSVKAISYKCVLEGQTQC
jgi:transcriptional regulator with GAF, ATPase, and Fis domain